MAQIVGGNGGTNVMSVNSAGQGEVFAGTEPIERQQNRKDSKAWVLPFKAIDPTGADDYFFYLSNESSALYAVTGVRIESTVAGTCEIHNVSGTASYTSETAVAPVNLFLGASRAMTNVTINTDANITGLTNEGTLGYIPLDAAGKENPYMIPANILIPPGQALALLWDTATGILTGTIGIVEVDDERA